MKIINAMMDDIQIKEFEAHAGQAWAIIGKNRSGIGSFFELVCGIKKETQTVGNCELPANIARVSFKDQQTVYEHELEIDESDYLGRLDPGTPAKAFIHQIDQFKEMIHAFEMTDCMEKGYRQLSTGQSRKLMILSQISQGRSVLAIQSPFDGLDRTARAQLSQSLEALFKQHILILLFVYDPDDIPTFCTHAALIKEGKIAFQGQYSKGADLICSHFKTSLPDFKVLGKIRDHRTADSSQAVDKKELVCLKNGFAGYGEQLVFDNLSISISQGDHTLVTGPNGSGKSTLLHLISGDHPACYKNDLMVFGIQRGTGESIWELKKRMGIVSPELHRNYYVPGPLIHCILSGLFDSIGLYKTHSRSQELEATKWLEWIGLAHKAKEPFRNLSFSDQRLALIARAMIKQPDLLILDEPTQGLDAINRKAMLDFLETLAAQNDTTILFVSHRQDEFRSFFKQRIEMATSNM